MVGINVAHEPTLAMVNAVYRRTDQVVRMSADSNIMSRVEHRVYISVNRPVRDKVYNKVGGL